jgi:bifunctional UDP-N-acetylglucosamine pyrophosphorylase/glucosamine-1-phosphate N-acetyltransferase
MKRLLIVPAAGRGSRLSASQPKLLVPVAGRPMIDHVLARYVNVADRAIVIVSPEAEADLRKRFAATSGTLPVDLAIQPEPTGMLDAILIPIEEVRTFDPSWVWITWCDQVAISEATVTRLMAAEEPPAPDVIVTSVLVPHPYIHLVRDDSGRIIRVLQRREGDAMPEIGEADSGLFALSKAAYLEHLTAFAAAPQIGRLTRERNFIPFIPWMASRGIVRTVTVGNAIEALGINTPEDLREIETYFAARPLSPQPGPSASPTRHS